MQGGKWHLGDSRWGGGGEVGERLTSAVETLKKGALPSLGGCKVSRQRSAPLLEAGVGSTELSFALHVAGCAIQAVLARRGGEMRGQSSTPVRASRGVAEGGWASSDKARGTGRGGGGLASPRVNAVRGG